MKEWTAQRLPKAVECLRDYSKAAFLHDLLAGITVGLVALPLAMAFAIASGLSPQAGIYCAVTTGFLISALGGSRFQIGGPTGAFVVVVSGIVARYGVDGLFMCTMMAGVLLVAAGLFGFGTAVRFIPRPVVVGFTNGIALVIASTQLRDFFGLQLKSVPGEFVPRLQTLAAHASTWSPAATTLATLTLAGMIVAIRLIPRVPPYILALVGGTAVVAALGIDVETIGTRFGGIPGGLPSVHIPSFRADLMLTLLSPALTVAMLGAIESLMSAVVADRLGGDRHNPNVELTAQGVANIVSPMVGGLPATGAIARTATNIRSGARTPVAGIIHALVLLAILLVGAPLAAHIPLAVLAAILLIVAYNMGEWGEIPELLRMSKTDITVWIVTFGLTVFADLTLAVEIGMILAALLFIRRISETTTVSEVTEEDVAEGQAHVLQGKDIPEFVRIFRIHGPFLFGVTDKLDLVAERLNGLPPVVVVRLRNMTAIDATGLRAIQTLADTLRRSGRTLLLCGAREQPARLMKQAGFEEHVGRENILPHVQAALERAQKIRRPEARSA